MMCSIDFMITAKPVSGLQLRLDAIIKRLDGSNGQRHGVCKPMPRCNTQINLARAASRFLDIRDVAVSRLADAESGPSSCNDVFGIQPAELPQQKHQSECICQCSNHELHQNGLGIAAPAIVRVSDK